MDIARLMITALRLLLSVRRTLRPLSVMVMAGLHMLSLICGGSDWWIYICVGCVEREVLLFNSRLASWLWC